MEKEYQQQEDQCRSHFHNESEEERRDIFTRLWVKVISQKENAQVVCFQKDNILQSKTS